MRVLMAPVNIAGQPITLTTELRRQGLDVSLLQFTAGDGHVFGYPGDQIFNIQGRHRLEAETEALRCALSEGYDIFHFWMSTFFGGQRYHNLYGLDLPFIKVRNRRIIYRATGFDLRVKSEHIARNPHHPFQHGYQLDIDEDAQRRFIDYLRSYVDLFIVQDPEMHEFMPQARVVPRAIDVEALAPAGIAPSDRPLIVHAPSKTLVKGTPILTRALDQLREEGLRFDFKLITGMRHEEALDWYRRADLIVDQLLLGWYGVLTIEGLALGKPVVVYLREDLARAFNPQIPVANANPSTVTDVLRPLIADFQARRALAEHGPEFVRAVHDVRRVAASLRAIYEEVMQTPVREPDAFADLTHLLAQFKAVEDLDERRRLAYRASRFEELVEELQGLRFKAAQAEELAQEVQALRFKAARLDELQAEVQALRYKAVRYDELKEEVFALRFERQQHLRER